MMGRRGTVEQEQVAIGRPQWRVCRRGSAQLQERGREVKPAASLQQYLLTQPVVSRADRPGTESLSLAWQSHLPGSAGREIVAGVGPVFPMHAHIGSTMK